MGSQVWPQFGEQVQQALADASLRYLSTNDAGQVFVMSDVLWTTLLNPRAEQGQHVPMPALGT